MEKIIYRGEAEGLFGYADFKRFMDNMESAKYIGSYIGNEDSTYNEEFVYEWKIAPFGIKLSYKLTQRYEAIVALEGNPEKLSVIEKQILEDAKKYNK